MVKGVSVTEASDVVPVEISGVLGSQGIIHQSIERSGEDGSISGPETKRPPHYSPSQSLEEANIQEARSSLDEISLYTHRIFEGTAVDTPVANSHHPGRHRYQASIVWARKRHLCLRSRHQRSLDHRLKCLWNMETLHLQRHLCRSRFHFQHRNRTYICNHILLLRHLPRVL